MQWDIFAYNFTRDDYLNCPNNKVKFLKTKREKRRREINDESLKKNVILIFFSTCFVCSCVDLVRFWALLPDWKNKLLLPFRNNNSMSYNETQSIEIYWMHILCGFFKPSTVASTLRVTYKFSKTSKNWAQRKWVQYVVWNVEGCLSRNQCYTKRVSEVRVKIHFWFLSWNLYQAIVYFYCYGFIILTFLVINQLLEIRNR